jgi:hypothetical protein
MADRLPFNQRRQQEPPRQAAGRLTVYGLVLFVSAVPTLCLPSSATAGEPPPAEATGLGRPSTLNSQNSTRGIQARELAGRIDFHLQQRWEAQSAVPAQRADDAEWFRRVYLDIAGKIPPVAELRAFLNDDAPDKRQRAVDRLLGSPRYIVNFTTMWRNTMIPEAAADPQLRFVIPDFEAWLRKKLTEDAGYAEMVYEILTTPLTSVVLTQGLPLGPSGTPTPTAFYRAKQLKPENLAAGTAQVFLGIRIDCAQCHDHPFDAWKREQFWELAAFYAGIEREEQRILDTILEISDRPQITIPDTDQVVQATFLDGSRPRWDRAKTQRGTLADWMTSRENPYFARAAVNRMWGHFFGTGLVHPVDDFGPENPPSHPELLDELAREFAARDFDLKFLIQAITASRAYHLSSELTHPSQEDPQLFARMAVKGLTPEQLVDSLAEATGFHQRFNPQEALAVNENNPRGELLETFANDSEEPTERTTTILQALAMMNGRLIADATDLETSETLAAIADFPLLDTAGRIEALFLAVLSRRPREAERSRLVKYVDSGGPQEDPQQALADVYWALLNSSEFLFNH